MHWIPTNPFSLLQNYKAPGLNILKKYRSKWSVMVGATNPKAGILQLGVLRTIAINPPSRQMCGCCSHRGSWQLFPDWAPQVNLSSSGLGLPGSPTVAIIEAWKVHSQQYPTATFSFLRGLWTKWIFLLLPKVKPLNCMHAFLYLSLGLISTLRITPGKIQGLEVRTTEVIYWNDASADRFQSHRRS